MNQISYIGIKNGRASHRINEALVLQASSPSPARIEDLRDFILLSSEKLKVYRAKIPVNRLNRAKRLRGYYRLGMNP